MVPGLHRGESRIAKQRSGQGASTQSTLYLARAPHVRGCTVQNIAPSPGNLASALGNLLSEFSFISSTDMRHAQQLATSTGLPLGKCFVLLDCISHEELQYVLEAQALLRENVVSLVQLGKAMEAVRRGWTLADALTIQGLDAHSTRRTRLGELLCDAGTINESPLRIALRIGDLCALPLGKVLVSFNAVDEPVVQLALKIQSDIRQGGLDRADAIIELEAFRQPETSSMHFRIGELLHRAGVLSASQISNALQTAEAEKKMVGETLVERHNVPEEVIATSLCVQELLDAQLIGVDGASGLISQVFSGIQSQGQQVSLNASPLTFFDFLRASGYLHEQKLSAVLKAKPDSREQAITSTKLKIGKAAKLEAMSQLADNPDELRQILLSEFPEDRQVLNCGTIIYELVRSKKLSVNQGLVVFGFRQRELKLAG